MNQENSPDEINSEDNNKDIEEVEIVESTDGESPDIQAESNHQELPPMVEAIPVAKPEISEQESTPEESKSAIAKRKREMAESKALTRKMTYIILFETIFIFIAAGMNGYSVYKLYKANHIIKEDNISLEKYMTTNLSLQQQLDNATKDNRTLSGKIEQWKADYDRELNEAKQINDEKGKKEEELAARNSEYEKLLQSKGDIENKLASAQAQIDELSKKVTEVNNDKFAALQQSYDQLKIDWESMKNTIPPKKATFSKQYDEYALKASKVIEALNNLQNIVTKGIDNIKFARDLDQVKFAMGEFRINTQEFSKLTSFRLIIAAFNAYQESDDCWKKLSATTLPKEVGSFRDKVIKFEQPIKEYRPWADAIQINWQMARYYLATASYVLQNRDAVNSIQCPVCHDKYSIVCPKCGGTGDCYFCKGQGQNDGVICLCCEGLGKCPLCKGKKEIPCPIFVLAPDLNAGD